MLDSNGKPFVEVTATREGSTLTSGIDGFTFMKATQSGWEKYVKDPYTTIPETHDRMCATSMVASWKWSAKPASYPATNTKILDTLLEVFGTTYSYSVQDSLYRMGEAAPRCRRFPKSAWRPEHAFHPDEPLGFRTTNNDVFLPTGHGQIECTVGRVGVLAPQTPASSGAVRSQTIRVTVT